MGKLTVPIHSVTVECDTGQVSDGYHTFDELYSHRCLLFALLCCYWAPGYAFKTRRNSNAVEIPGWFIAGIETRYGQITYHLPDELWSLVTVEELDSNENYDGHTAKDVEERLRKLLQVGH